MLSNWKRNFEQRNKAIFFSLFVSQLSKQLCLGRSVPWYSGALYSCRLSATVEHTVLHSMIRPFHSCDFHGHVAWHEKLDHFEGLDSIPTPKKLSSSVIKRGSQIRPGHRCLINLFFQMSIKIWRCNILKRFTRLISSCIISNKLSSTCSTLMGLVEKTYKTPVDARGI